MPNATGPGKAASHAPSERSHARDLDTGEVMRAARPRSHAGRYPSVDGDDGAGQVGPGARREVDRDARHVLRLADPAKGTGGDDGVTESPEGLGHHLALEGTR